MGGKKSKKRAGEGENGEGEEKREEESPVTVVTVALAWKSPPVESFSFYGVKMLGLLHPFPLRFWWRG